METPENDSKKSSSHEALKRKALAEVREKIDRGLEQLDEGQGISAEEARAHLRRAS